jgi:hypothetical protein
MNTIALNDLTISKNLDKTAMTAIKGRGEWHLRSSSSSMSGWSYDTLLSKDYQGQQFHDGYLSKHYIEGYKRTRVETQYRSYDHFVRV